MYLFGASGHGKVILDILLSSGKKVDAVYDDDPHSDEFLGVPLLKTDSSLWQKPLEFIIAVGNNQIRKQLAQKLNGIYLNAIHPSAVISPFTKISEGSVLMAHTTINPGSEIGKHCIINTNSSVDHDCIVEDFVHISPNVGLAGNVVIGEGTHIGIGACVIQGVKIGKWCIIGAGSVIIKDIPDYAVVVGNPARIIKFQNK